LALGQQARVAAQTLGEGDDTGLERSTHLVVRVGADVGKEAVYRVVDLGEEPVIDGVGNPPGRLVVQPLSERRLVVLEKATETGDHRIEQPLMMPALDRQVDRLRQQWCDGCCPDAT